MSAPVASIITPLYNAETLFSSTASSVLAQTYQDFEWIIVDDCSTDSSADIAFELSQRDSRIAFVKCDINRGSAAARNKGLEIARGRYITFLDADDLLEPNYLESQLAFIQKNGPIITASYKRVASSSETVFHVPATTTYKSILKGNPLSCLTTMYDRRVFENARFPEDMNRHEDYVFWALMLKQGYEAKGNLEILATYRLQAASKNSNKAKLIKPMVDAYHKKLGLSYINSVFHTIGYVFYSKKKYKGVK